MREAIEILTGGIGVKLSYHCVFAEALGEVIRQARDWTNWIRRWHCRRRLEISTAGVVPRKR